MRRGPQRSNDGGNKGANGPVGSANLFAYLTLALCPLVSLALVALLRPAIACPIIMLAGQMFMPPMLGFDLPVLPEITKEVLVPLSALFACVVLRRRSLAGSRPGRGYDLFVVAQMLGFVGTVLTNSDPIRFGPLIRPGYALHEIVSGMLESSLFWWPPFYLGRALTRTSKDLKNLFVIVAIAGLVYTPFLLIEMRLSPQLNLWIYGYHQTLMIQTLRGSGFRPKVFMRHGLNVAFFMAFTVLAAAALHKARQRVLGVKAGLVALYLLAFLILCRSAGALTYVLMFAPLLLLTRPPTQARWAAGLALVVFSYPVLRAIDLVPVDSISHFFLSVFGEERASSLAYRLEQEGIVLRRALERIVFGWGGYDRQFPHDQLGRKTFFIDGLWVIQIGARGLIGYLAMFGMLLVPAWRARRTIAGLGEPRDRVLVACLALMAVLYALDLIPNSSVDPYLTYLVGALVGTERGLTPGPAPVAAPGLRLRRLPVDEGQQLADVL
jgi:hypothetical protein